VRDRCPEVSPRDRHAGSATKRDLNRTFDILTTVFVSGIYCSMVYPSLSIILSRRIVCRSEFSSGTRPAARYLAIVRRRAWSSCAGRGAGDESAICARVGLCRQDVIGAPPARRDISLTLSDDSQSRNDSQEQRAGCTAVNGGVAILVAISEPL
jgi:hypothetical protein